MYPLAVNKVKVESNKLIELHKIAFNDGDYANFFFKERLPYGRSYVIEQNGEPVSACYARFIELNLMGKELTIPFLTGVATHPDYRYQGLARKVVLEAKESLKNEGYPFAILHPFNHDFYRKLGFETINYVRRFSPLGKASTGVEFIPMALGDLPLVKELYDRYVIRNNAYRARSLKEFELLIGTSLKNGGMGYVIRQNGVPKGYIWCEDGAVAEAVAEEEYLFDGAPLDKAYTIPSFTHGSQDYSMASILNVEALFKAIPYASEANGSVYFTLNGQSYCLTVKHGNFLSLTSSDHGVEISDRQLIAIALGQGNKSEVNPFDTLIPKYNLACSEIY